MYSGTKSQGISSHGIDLFLAEYSGFSNRWNLFVHNIHSSFPIVLKFQNDWATEK